MDKNNGNIRESVQGRFGTFGGVFTPCTLTILGVIMFLRFGQVVGNAGIWHALLIVAMAKAITTLTALSLSAIATNTRVRGGGAYYMISRSLGVEFGGAIGLVFYLSQAVAVAMYVIGFTEALVAAVPAMQGHFTLTASLVNLAVFGCVYSGAGWTIKVQYGILTILGLAIVSFVAGGFIHLDASHLSENLKSGYTGGHTIWTMFALFFPAATGIMAGANMSGDLKDPARSIPRGTLLAIGVTGVVYMVFAVLLGVCVDRTTLLADSMVVRDKAWIPILVTAGIFAATLSSALGSLMGAPRILQALATDRIIGFLGLFARGSGPNNEPRRAIVLSFMIAQGGILVGDLNTIAPIVTMFFMITYGALNYAAFQEAYSRNPSYRPRFRYNHWLLSLAGALCCAAAMILIDWFWAIIAVAVMVAIYRYLVRSGIETSWGDLNSGAALERVRRDLLILEQEKYHPKNWRPAIIAFGMHREDRLYLAAVARWLAGPSGLLMLGQVLASEDEDVLVRHRQAVRLMRNRIADNELEAFPAVTVAASVSSGMSALVQCSGVGAIRANLVVMEWLDDPEGQAGMLATMNMVSRLGRSLALLRYGPVLGAESIWEPPAGTIDVWWLGQDNGSLMLLLAHLLRHNDGWRDHRIRLLRVIKDAAGVGETRRYLEQLGGEARITVDCEVLVGESFGDILIRESRHSALSILGLSHPGQLTPSSLERLTRLTRPLPRVLFVHSAGDMSLDA